MLPGELAFYGVRRPGGALVVCLKIRRLATDFQSAARSAHSKLVLRSRFAYYGELQ